MNRQKTLLVLLTVVGLAVAAFWFTQLRTSESAPKQPGKTVSVTNIARATPPAAKAPANPPPKTAIPSPIAKGKAATNATTVPPKNKPGTNALATAKQAGTNTPALSERLSKITSGRGFLPAVGLVLVGIILLLLAFRSRKSPATAVPATTIPAAAKKQASKPASQCNVLSVGDGQKLWQFSVRNGAFVLTREHKADGGLSLPKSAVAKDWRSLLQRKLNIAWLPPENVFLRVAQFPKADFGETLAMVELQLEKLSPIPAAQVVWGIQVLPHPEENLQTVVVLIASRTVVEEFLGRLEAQGFQADRLEMPFLDEMEATPRSGDGAWVYAGASDGVTAGIVAWWYEGVLCNLDLVNLPHGGSAAVLREQLTQMAWAGELEGWLKSPPSWHLVADETSAAVWEPVLREAVEQPIEVIPRRAAPELASLTASRSARDERQTNLLPAEFLTRYQQQFVDRLWMRGLGAVLLVYMAGVGIYMVALQYALFRTRAVEEQVAESGPAYTNSLQLQARYEVLKDRQELKYAALDCWKAVAELLPETVTLEGMNFSDGRRVTLNGSAPAADVKQLLEFEGAMRKAKAKEQPLFDPAKGDNLSYRAGSGNTVTWGFTLELKRVELQ